MADERDMADGVARRSFLKGAATVAWATPLILTMTAHPAGAQMSCTPNGTTCDACFGPNCCDAELPEDGGCCCSDPNVPGCSGLCMASDASCESMPSVDQTDPDNDTFICFAPDNVTINTVGRARAGKGAKS